MDNFGIIIWYKWIDITATLKHHGSSFGHWGFASFPAKKFFGTSSRWPLYEIREKPGIYGEFYWIDKWIPMIGIHHRHFPVETGMFQWASTKRRWYLLDLLAPTTAPQFAAHQFNLILIDENLCSCGKSSSIRSFTKPVSLPVSLSVGWGSIPYSTFMCTKSLLTYQLFACRFWFFLHCGVWVGLSSESVARQHGKTLTPSGSTELLAQSSLASKSPWIALLGPPESGHV